MYSVWVVVFVALDEFQGNYFHLAFVLVNIPDINRRYLSSNESSVKYLVILKYFLIYLSNGMLQREQNYLFKEISSSLKLNRFGIAKTKSLCWIIELKKEAKRRDLSTNMFWHMNNFINS